MKIIEYTNVTEAKKEDRLLLDGAEGTRNISPDDLVYSGLSEIPPQDRAPITMPIDKLSQSAGLMGDDWIPVSKKQANFYENVKLHPRSFLFGLLNAIEAEEGVAITDGIKRSIPRCQNIGNFVTDYQWEEIANGTFRGMFLGDFWRIGDVNYRIVDFDYWSQTGTGSVPKHLVIVPDTILTSAVMEDTGTSVNGYLGTKMRTRTLIQEILPMLESLFGADHILSHMEVFTNAYNSGGMRVNDSKVELMNEEMLFGTVIHTKSDAWNLTTSKTQLALFQALPQSIAWSRAHFWLRSIHSEATFCSLQSDGVADYNNSANKYGVRPVFAIC